MLPRWLKHLENNPLTGLKSTIRRFLKCPHQTTETSVWMNCNRCRGGSNPGTWMHERCRHGIFQDGLPGLPFGVTWPHQANDPDGQTSMGSISEDQKILDAFGSFNKGLKPLPGSSRLRIRLSHQARKVEYYDEVLDSKDLISTTIIAKDLGMSASALTANSTRWGNIPAGWNMGAIFQIPG